MTHALNYFELLKNESPGIFYKCSNKDGWPITHISNNIEIFGFSKIDILNNKVSFKDMMHPEDYDRIEIELAEVLKKKQDIAHFEWRLISPNGEQFWIREKAILERDMWGKVKSYHGLLVDVSKEKKASNELRIVKDMANQYQEMIDQIAIVASTDLKGRITYVNEEFCKVSGFYRNELIGQTHSVVNSGLHDKAFFKNMWRTIGRGQIWRGQVANKKKNGEIYWLETAIVPFMDNGKVTHYMAIRFDISESKRLEKLLEEEQRLNELTTHLATIGEMSTGVMHEINNPLSIISFHLDYVMMQLEKGELNDKMLSHSLSKMKLGVKRASKVTTSLRSLSKFNSDEKDRKVDLKKLIDETLDLCVFKLKKNSVEVKLKRLTNLESIFSKSTAISQILINLINNSIDAIENLEDKWIKIILEETDRDLLISIQDSGKGICSEVAAEMMNPFYTTKERGKGTGVGLSLCRHLAEKLEGELYYNEYLSHTTFTLRLPLVNRL